MGIQLHQRAISAQLCGDGVVQPVQPGIDDVVSLLV
jgi:hypothetical protein